MKLIKIIIFPISLVLKIKSLIRLKYLKIRGIKIGDKTYISPKAYIDIHHPGKVIIGSNCFIARNAMILCHTSVTKGGPTGIWVKYGGKMEFHDVIIGNNVLVGANVVILPGVKIGNNVIIGANCVVNKDIPSNKVIGGVPCKILTDTKELLKTKCDNFDEQDWVNNYE